MDRKLQIHEMTLDYLHSAFPKHKSVNEYVERYQFIYAEIDKLMSQSETLKQQ